MFKKIESVIRTGNQVLLNRVDMEQIKREKQAKHRRQCCGARRDFIMKAGIGALSLNLFAAGIKEPLAMSKAQELMVYLGTYTDGKSKGIYAGKLNLDSGAVTLHGLVTGAVNPSYLAIDRRGRYLYAVNEVSDFRGEQSGAVTSFSINRETHDLDFLNQQPSRGGLPCYVSLDKQGRYAFVANFAGGNLAAFPVMPDGRLGEASDVVQHHGSSVVRPNQQAPHAHSIAIDPSGAYVIAADLGIDRLMIYRFDWRRGKFSQNNPAYTQFKPGSGPRHFVFHPRGRLAFVINELASTVTSLTYDPQGGVMKEVQTVSTLPRDFTGVNSCADLHISSAGDFLYGSNRGHDSIVVFAVNEKTGTLNPVQHQPTGGKTPRNFCLDPTGNFLLAANQDSDTIVSFRIDRRTGKLTPTSHVTEVPAPVCIKFFIH